MQSDDLMGDGQAVLMRLTDRLDVALQRLAGAPDFAKPGKLPAVLDTSKRLLLAEGGPSAIEQRAHTLESARVFAGSDWDHPELLLASLSPHALSAADEATVLIECLSELRLVAIATGDLIDPRISAPVAKEYLTQVLAANLTKLLGSPSEADRERQGRLAQVSRNVLRHIADRVGYEQILGLVVEEVWRILHQRPIQVDAIRHTITQIAVYQDDPDIDLGGGFGADRLVSSLYGTTLASREDPGLEVYRERIGALDRRGLRSEASGFSRAMHDTGLVSPYHAVLLRELGTDDDMLAVALGLTNTGRDSLLRNHELVHRLIEVAIHPETAQAVYGLALLLERGILHQPPVAPALWRQLRLVLTPGARQRLEEVFGSTPTAHARLLSGVLSMLGLPLGVGQGDNPTCQSARALAMWAQNDPDYLLHIVASAARDDEIVHQFEGQSISSMTAGVGVAKTHPTDLDPVSTVVVPHLDRIYAEMGRRCIGRDGDPHRWINPEFHGWWAWRGFRINVDVTTGHLVDLDDFLGAFYAAYHPDYNGDQPLTHPQPAGIAATDRTGRFVGWHAIAILRVRRDAAGVMRVYFFNPNNDSGQDWGDGVVVSTSEHGEHFGESSLPFEQFASRLYIFHFDPLEPGHRELVPAEHVAATSELVLRSWGSARVRPEGVQANESFDAASTSNQ